MLPREHRRSYTLAAGKTLEPRPEAGGKYVRYQFYTGWENNLYNAAAFDSESGEAKLACDLDVSPTSSGGPGSTARTVRIAYGANSTYHPDFIVRDTAGRTWIVEGKDERGRTDEEVQRKRDAAEEAINLMSTDPDMCKLSGLRHRLREGHSGLRHVEEVAGGQFARDLAELTRRGKTGRYPVGTGCEPASQRLTTRFPKRPSV